MAGGRETGVKNYKKPLLLDIIKEVLPAGAEAWKLVAQLYWQRSQEPTLRDYNDVKTIYCPNTILFSKACSFKLHKCCTRKPCEVSK